MKKIIKYSILSLISALLIIWVSRIYYKYPYNWDITMGFERAAYISLTLTCISFFVDITRKIKHRWGRMSVFTMGALIYTVGIILLNNYWRWIYLNGIFGWREEYFFSYKSVALEDLKYCYGLGEYRYPLVFVAVLGILVLIDLFKDKVVQIWEKLYEWMYRNGIIDDKLKQSFLDARFYAVYRFQSCVENMPHNETGKRRLMELVDKYEKYKEAGPVYMLLKVYGDMLTREEYIKYRHLYYECLVAYIERVETRSFLNEPQKELLPVLRELDLKFGIERK